MIRRVRRSAYLKGVRISKESLGLEVSLLWVPGHKDILQLALKHLDEPLWELDYFSAISSGKITQEVCEGVGK